MARHKWRNFPFRRRTDKVIIAFTRLHALVGPGDHVADGAYHGLVPGEERSMSGGG
jgi:hypothetical protein